MFVKIISFIDPYLIPGSARGDDENKIRTQKYVFTCVKTIQRKLNKCKRLHNTKVLDKIYKN